MPSLAQLDHAVINVHFAMDLAEPLFEALGFTLTPRGYHSLGSINHLMTFGSDYLELIGLPEGGEDKRPEILASPVGIDGLVFKTSDVDETFAHLQALDMAGDPPRAFSRSVYLSSGEATATFRTVTVRSDVFPAGRVYFCEHGTPELIWRREWQTHANGAAKMAEIVIVSTDPEAEATRYASLVEAPKLDGQDGAYRIPLAEAELSVLSPAQYTARYKDLVSPMNRRPSIFGAVVMASLDLAAVTERLKFMPEPVPVAMSDNRISMRMSEFDSVLEFVE
ncbi:MAG: hypothetical protein ETSY1_27495 [Candidatus Entotheonella factor]|uniref:Glyoxalase-like domain-containing protein n=1 Tax=Entotheonella factor TaxID=1429438 RepID=W4LET5_ENTF1|nr:VOC family protein [Candidatus Entotheonella palauensis]ETW96215.1 MAG: hypothetical protein ETSY1_27495 [Candidatus Entotheonella factor]